LRSTGGASLAKRVGRTVAAACTGSGVWNAIKGAISTLTLRFLTAIGRSDGLAASGRGDNLTSSGGGDDLTTGGGLA
jgi:hypothetical protein